MGAIVALICDKAWFRWYDLVSTIDLSVLILLSSGRSAAFVRAAVLNRDSRTLISELSTRNDIVETLIL